jgi:hypothetical protein
MTTFWLCIIYVLYSGFIDILVSNKVKYMQLNSNSQINDNFDIENFDFISTINPYSKIVEKMNDRKIWNSLLDKKTYPELLSGKYKFLYRNLANFEEKLAICKRVNTVHSLFFKMKDVGYIEVYKDKVIMTEQFIFIGFLNFSIKWYGNLNYNKKIINWKKSILFHPFGIKNNPEFYEKLRKIPWKITHTFNNIYIFESCNYKRFAYQKIT